MERTIQTFKTHFKAGLASLDPDLSLSECDRLIHQAVLTLNLLRSARANPDLLPHIHIRVFEHSKPNFWPAWAQIMKNTDM